MEQKLSHSQSLNKSKGPEKSIEQDRVQPLELENSSKHQLLEQDMNTSQSGAKNKVTVDDIVRAIPFGRFQVLMIVIFHLIYSSPSIVVYNYAYFELFPQYLCKDTVDGTWYDCSREEMCLQQQSAGNFEDFDSQVDWNNPASLRNWITRLNLDCSSDSVVIGLFGTYEYVGQFIACIIFPFLADIFGRRVFTFIGLGIQTICFIGLIAFKKYVLYYVLIFFLGNAVIIRYLIVYAHLMEFVANKQNLITGIFLFLDGLVYIYSPLILIYIVPSTQYFVWLGFIFSVASIFLLAYIFHMPESLKFSLAKQDIMKFQNDMEYICDMNKVSDDQRKYIDHLVERYCFQVRQQQKMHLIEVKEGKGKLMARLCKDKDSFYNLGLMMICWVSTTFTYFLVIFLVKYLPGNLYTNQIVSGFSVIGYLITPLLTRKFDNKWIMIFGYIVSLVFLVLMVVVESSNISEIGYSIIFFLFKCGVSMVFISLFVIHQDLFQTKYLASSYGFCNTISRIAALGTPFVAEVKNNNIPVIIMIIINGIALVAAYFLRMNKIDK